MLPHDDKYIGGLIQAPKGQEKTYPSHWLSFINVDDIHASLSKAEKLGATIVIPVTTIGNRGQVAIIIDPVGATIGLRQPPE